MGSRRSAGGPPDLLHDGSEPRDAHLMREGQLVGAHHVVGDEPAGLLQVDDVSVADVTCGVDPAVDLGNCTG